MGKQSLGFYYIEKIRQTEADLKANRTRWRVRHESYLNGERVTKTIERDLYPQLGFLETYTIEQAKSAAKALNSKTNLDREAFRKAATKAKEIEARNKLVDSAFLPEHLVTEFRKHLSTSHFGNANYDKKQHSRWNTVMEIIAELEIDPKEFNSRKAEFYKLFISECYSPDTVRKFIYILNLWGKFVSRKRDKHYDEIEVPRGNIREKIAEAYAESEDSRVGGAFPLTVPILFNLKSKLEHLPGKYEWMHVSLWLGLRPSEINAINEGQNYRIVYDSESELEVLWVYQPKLVALKKDQRWKRIPLIYPEQRDAVEYIKAGTLDQPLNKTLQSLTDIETLGSYSGRKGFTDLMLELGQDFVNVSLWLGHSNIDQTYKNYKDKKKVTLAPIKKPKKTS